LLAWLSILNLLHAWLDVLHLSWLGVLYLLHLSVLVVHELLALHLSFSCFLCFDVLNHAAGGDTDTNTAEDW